MAGVQVASLYATIALRDDVTGGLKKVRGGLSDLSKQLDGVGSAMAKLGAPLAAGFGLAVKSAVDFDSAMHNIAAVTGATGKNLSALSQEIRQIGVNSRFGATETANAFYDIAGGVVDASSRMAVLQAAITTAEAGQADLGTTTQALIAIMNGYGFGAKQAAFASDVLTRTVGMGVGTMNDFATALPQVAGMAKASGVKFDDLGSAMAFVTTKGVSASEAATQLSGMMTALLKPNADMEKALKKLGFSTGQAAIKNLGLVGTYKALLRAGFGDEMASLTGRVEAFRGVIALTGGEFTKFDKEFKGGITGATGAAQGIQMGSAAAQIDLLKAQMEDLSITVGDALLPGLIDLAKELRPVIGQFADWAKQNPEVVKTVAKVAFGLVGGGGLLIAVSQVTSAVTGLVGGLGRLLIAFLPLAPVIALVGGIVALYTTNFAGFRDRVDELGAALRRLPTDLQNVATAMTNPAFQAGQSIFNPMGAGVNTAADYLTGAMASAASRPYMQAGQNLPPVTQVGNIFAPGGGAVNAAGDYLQQAMQRNAAKNYYAGVIPTRDSGGSVRAGQSVLIGRGAQPELFRPRSAGTMYPAGSYGTGPKMLTVVLRADNFEEKIILDIAEAMRG